MIKIDSLSAWARRNPNKIRKIDPEKWAKAQASIERALKSSKLEHANAAKSASEIILSI